MGAACPCFAGLAGAEGGKPADPAATGFLLVAAKKKDEAAAKKAIADGADVNVVNGEFFNYTPLHLFAGTGAVELCTLLLSKGATVDPRSQSDETPLIMAARAKHKAVVELLLGHGADESAETNYAPPMRKSAAKYIEEMYGS
eukprot:TRINITY_DN94802_c0_g1_i1.p1 TRINITY_DN94802_c0_g1~~TRINITY_DN94802_c0_g1_i1.p1  ORF type:complete len:160 (+),score=48.00 TRINITY_DN94802_c0_g1_i1:54-482(+)